MLYEVVEFCVEDYVLVYVVCGLFGYEIFDEVCLCDD